VVNYPRMGTWHAGHLVDHSTTQRIYSFTSDSVSSGQFADEKQDPVESGHIIPHRVLVSHPVSLSLRRHSNMSLLDTLPRAWAVDNASIKCWIRQTGKSREVPNFR
jgi:hypothetical protein